MKAACEHPIHAERPCDMALKRLRSEPLEPIMFCQWRSAFFINLEVDRVMLQRHIPFTLELYHGRAIVSLVAFHVVGLRPRFGGRVGAALFRPLQIYTLFNVRTYVRCQGEPAICFLAEWLPSRLNLHLGPLTYGLPYRLGQLTYRHDAERGLSEGQVQDCATSAQLRYRARVQGSLAPSCPGSLDEFVLERYTCFTHFRGPRRFFRIWHPPWPQSRVELIEFDRGLLTAHWPWLGEAAVISVNYSPGFAEVWLGRPHFVRAPARSAFFDMP